MKRFKNKQYINKLIKSLLVKNEIPLVISAILCSLCQAPLENLKVIDIYDILDPKKIIDHQTSFSCSSLDNTFITDICNLALFPSSDDFLVSVESAFDLDYVLNTTIPLLMVLSFLKNI